MQKIIEIIKKYKIYIICIAIISLSTISIIIQHFDRKNIIAINENKLLKKDNMIAVYITGEIKKEGVYYLNPESRLEKVIELAGGLTDKADLSNVNLSRKLVDSDKINIPAKNNNLVQENLENNNEDDKSYFSSTDTININEASIEELETLDGIGKSTAKKIIEYRKNQKFEYIEDIMKVPGIGEAKYNKIKDMICVK